MAKFNPEGIKRNAKAFLPCIIYGIAFHLIVSPDSVNLREKNFDYR
jgi:hypothetical protein